mgnify:CR=1 FL=1
MRLILIALGILFISANYAGQPVKTSHVSAPIEHISQEYPVNKKKRKNGRGALITFGILMILSGFSVLMVNGILVWVSSALAALWWVGIGLLVVGLLFIILASRIKKESKKNKEIKQ